MEKTKKPRAKRTTKKIKLAKGLKLRAYCSSYIFEIIRSDKWITLKQLSSGPILDKFSYFDEIDKELNLTEKEVRENFTTATEDELQELETINKPELTDSCEITTHNNVIQVNFSYEKRIRGIEGENQERFNRSTKRFREAMGLPIRWANNE